VETIQPCVRSATTTIVFRGVGDPTGGFVDDVHFLGPPPPVAMAEPIPTLSRWILVATSALVAFVGTWLLLQRGNRVD